MNNKVVGALVVVMMSGILSTILGIIKFVNPDQNDSKELLLGVVYLLSGLTMVGTSIYRLIVKK